MFAVNYRAATVRERLHLNDFPRSVKHPSRHCLVLSRGVRDTLRHMFRIAIALCLMPPAFPAWGLVKGGLKRTDDTGKPLAVSNNVAQPGDEVVTLRYFRIRKGTFDQFLKASAEDVWPYYEKIGARVIGMWKVIPPPEGDGQPVAARDYDEVYLSTRYASMAHWAATRDRCGWAGTGRIGSDANGGWICDRVLRSRRR